MNADRGILHVQTVGRNVGVSDAGQIWSDYGESFGQHGDDRLPHERGLRIAMQQNDRRTVASGHVMELGAIDLSAARDDCFVCDLSVSRRGEGAGEKEWTEDSQAQKKVQRAFHEKLLTRGHERQHRSLS